MCLLWKCGCTTGVTLQTHKPTGAPNLPGCASTLGVTIGCSWSVGAPASCSTGGAGLGGFLLADLGSIGCCCCCCSCFFLVLVSALAAQEVTMFFDCVSGAVLGTSDGSLLPAAFGEGSCCCGCDLLTMTFCWTSARGERTPRPTGIESTMCVCVCV